MTVKRIWHGWTTAENADAYEQVLRTVVAPSIADSGIEGYRGIELLRDVAANGNEVAFVTIMTFDSLDNIIAFQGEDYARAHVPDVAQKVLKRWDSHAQHFHMRPV